MSVMVGENPLLKIGAGAMVLVVGAVIFRSFSGGDNGHQQKLAAEQGEGQETVQVQRQDARLGAEADTPETSIEALAKQLGDMRRDLVKLGEDKKSGIGASVSPQPNSQVLTLQEELRALKEELANKNNNVQPQPVQPSSGQLVDAYPELPPTSSSSRDFGVQPNELPASNNNRIDLPQVPNLFNPNKGKPSSSAGVTPVSEGGVEWIVPSDATKAVDERTGKEVVTYPEFKGVAVNPHFRDQGSSAPDSMTEKEEKDSLVPIYTIPENASFLGSVGATALIGRVPLNNQVTDPFPFKVVVGRKNLATNGINIPNLQGMVVSGFARGDYTLKCLYGQINSVTYTFVDGTIRTISDKGKSDGAGLGYLADGQGVPCISGKYITNLPSYLGQTMGINAVAGMAEACANGQQQTTQNTDGSSSSIVNGSGDSMRYMLGKGVGAGVQSGSDALAQRQQGAYDAVYVAPGSRVEIHLTSQLNIDYDKKGRKVSHVQPVSHYSSSRGLD